MKEYLYLEHDGKLLLVDNEGKGPEIPIMGRIHGGDSLIRLPTVEEVKNMGIEWNKKRENFIYFENYEVKVIVGFPQIEWPENWAWKDSVISDNAVHPLVRESVYRTIHRVVSKVIIENEQGMILMAKASRGFFNGCWTLPGGFVDYGEHPREAAVREALEELGVVIEIPDPLNSLEKKTEGEDGAIVQAKIFNDEGINWVSFTYKCKADLEGQEISPKDDEIEEARWFTKEEAIRAAVSEFDIDAINTHLE